MDEVRIHCYGCPAVVAVDSRAPEEGLRAAGWTLVHGETYCPECGGARSLSAPLQPTGSPAGDLATNVAPPRTLRQPAAGSGLNGDESAVPTTDGASVSTMSADSATPSREVVVLDGLEERARRYIGIGAVTAVIGALLFAGLSSSPVGVVLAAAVVVGGPLLQLLDDKAQPLTKHAIRIYLAIMVFWLVVSPLVHGWSVGQVGKILGWVSVLVGPADMWAGVRSLRLLSAGRDSLVAPAYDVRLETKVLKGYLALPPTLAPARLWPSDPALLPGAGQIAPPLAQFRWQLSEPQLVTLTATPAKVYGAPIKRAVVVVSCPEAVLVGRVKRSHFGESPSPPKPMSPLMAWLWKPRSLRLR